MALPPYQKVEYVEEQIIIVHLFNLIFEEQVTLRRICLPPIVFLAVKGMFSPSFSAIVIHILSNQPPFSLGVVFCLVGQKKFGLLLMFIGL